MLPLEVIKHIGVIPMSVEKPCTFPSNGELRRWIEQKAVLLNGVTPGLKEEINFPITQLIFFPKSKRKTTVI